MKCPGAFSRAFFERTGLGNVPICVILQNTLEESKHDGIIASMKTTMQEWDGWLRLRFRSYIWKQWKNPRTRVKNLMKLGMPQWQAYRNGNSRKGYWAIAGSGILTHTITNKRLAAAGYFDILSHYESVHLCD